MRHVIGITLLALTLATTSAGAEDRIELKVGEAKSVALGDLERLAIGNPDFAEVRPGDGGKLELTGRAPGSTKLVVWKRSGDMSVYTVQVSGSTPAPAPAPDETVTLKKGEAKALPVKDLKRVAVGDPEVATIESDAKGVVKMAGLKAGETALIVWSGEDMNLKAYRIVVRE